MRRHPRPVSGHTQRLLHTTATTYAKRDYYEVLGVSRDVSASDLKSAYYKLAKQYHPDTNRDNKEAQRKFAEISEAYEVLSDPAKKAQFDQYGHDGPQAGGFGGDGGFGGFHNAEDLFASLFGGRAGGRSADVQVQVELSFDEAVKGCTRRLEFPVRVSCEPCGGTGAAKGTSTTRCPVCNGTGREMMNMGIMQMAGTCRKCSGRGTIIKTPCPTCRGQTYVQKILTRDVNIPPGIADGTQMRMQVDNTMAYVIVRVQDSPLFQRQDNNVLSIARISIGQAVLGGEVKIPGLYGEILLKVKPGTQNGRVLRLPERGFQAVHGTRKGDHLVQMEVAIPTNLTAAQKEAIRAWAAVEPGRVGSVEGVAAAGAGGGAGSGAGKAKDTAAAAGTSA